MLYIHIPFCRQLCAYCDFWFSVSMERKSKMINALCSEMMQRTDYLQRPLFPATLYFGGGTPSILTHSELQQLTNCAKQLCGTDVFSEFTVEINPDDITYDYALQLRAIGINRLSIGIQSFNEYHLKQLRRRHSAMQAIECVKTVKAAGFENITIDLMYGLPNQTQNEWEQDIIQAMELHIPHISAYHLTIEPQTIFGKQFIKGLLTLPNEDTSVQMFLFLHTKLTEAGYEHYEVSNFALKGFRAQHNSGYWNGFPYIGIGPSAHSYDGWHRQWNVANNIQYIRAVENNVLSFESETLTAAMRFNEYIITSLRTADGADIQYITNEFGEHFAEHCQKHAQKYINTNLLTYNDYKLKILPQNFIISDNIIREIFWSE